MFGGRCGGLRPVRARSGEWGTRPRCSATACGNRSRGTGRLVRSAARGPAHRCWPSAARRPPAPVADRSARSGHPSTTTSAGCGPPTARPRPRRRCTGVRAMRHGGYAPSTTRASTPRLAGVPIISTPLRPPTPPPPQPSPVVSSRILEIPVELTRTTRAPPRHRSGRCQWSSTLTLCATESVMWTGSSINPRSKGRARIEGSSSALEHSPLIARVGAVAGRSSVNVDVPHPFPRRFS